MLIFWEAKLVFLAAPKTGSTAIAEALGAQASVSVQRPPVLKHTTVHRFHRFIGPYLEAASKEDWSVVALIREPRDWLGSWYRYRRREDQPDPAKSTREISFDTFVRDWCTPRPPAHADVGSQERFLRPHKGLGLTQLFRYEEMDRFTAFLSARLGREVALPRVNVSPSADLRLSPATAALLLETAAADYQLHAGLIAPRTRLEAGPAPRRDALPAPRRAGEPEQARPAGTTADSAAGRPAGRAARTPSDAL